MELSEQTVKIAYQALLQATVRGAEAEVVASAIKEVRSALGAALSKEN